MTKLTDMLDRYREEKGVVVRVGLIGSGTYPDGELVSMVGYINEYGYSGLVPARTATIRHAVDADGNISNGGKFIKKGAGGIERSVKIPEYQLEIPARPFFRTAVFENKNALKSLIAATIESDGISAAAEKAGQFMVEALSESVNTWQDPPNAKSTVRAKGYNAPLRANDRILRNSFTYEIEE